MLRQTERRHLTLKLVAGLAAFYLLVQIANAAPNPANDTPSTTSKVQTNPRPVTAKGQTLQGTNNKNPTTTAVRDATTAAPTVPVTKHVVPLSNWSFGEKEIKGCPAGEILADDGTCRKSAG